MSGDGLQKMKLRGWEPEDIETSDAFSELAELTILRHVIFRPITLLVVFSLN
jgi:hypothetical protein